MHFRGGEGVAFGGRDPRVENLVARPNRDDDGVAGVGTGFEDQFAKDAVRFPDAPPFVDPREVLLANLGWHCDGSETHDHRERSLREAAGVTGVSVVSCGTGTPRNQRQRTMSYT